MSQPPQGGPGAAPSGGAGSGSTDFGAMTMSGKARESRPGSAGEATTTALPSLAPASPASSSASASPVSSSLPGRGTATATATRAGASAGGRATRARGPRRARLQLRHINPWTVLKFACVLSIALFFVWLIVIGILYGVLDAAGAIDKVNDTVTTINGDGSNKPITAGLVFGGAAIIGVINIVLFIALSTVGAVIYNLCADLVGGVEVTLSVG